MRCLDCCIANVCIFLIPRSVHSSLTWEIWFQSPWMDPVSAGSFLTCSSKNRQKSLEVPCWPWLGAVGCTHCTMPSKVALVSAAGERTQGTATVFHNTPARREDFSTLTKTSVFPLPFCGHRWIENLPIVKKAIAVWSMIVMYVDAVTKKEIPNPKTSSYDALAEARKDSLIMAEVALLHGHLQDLHHLSDYIPDRWACDAIHQQRPGCAHEENE